MKKLLTLLLLSPLAFTEELTLACEHKKTDFYDYDNEIDEIKRNLRSKSIVLDLENKTAQTNQGKKSYKERDVEIWWQYRNDVPGTSTLKGVKWIWNHTLDRFSGSYLIEESFCVEGRTICSRQEDAHYECAKKEKIF